MPVSEIIGEAVREHHLVEPEEFDDYIDSVMIACGLPPYYKERYPHEFSGGPTPTYWHCACFGVKP